jgi:putative hemolysin
VVDRGDGTYIVDAQITFYDFLTYFNKTEWLEDEQEFDTLAGCILQVLEHIPQVGEKLQWREFDLEVIDMDGHRIDKIMVKPSEEIKEEMEED